MVVVVPKLLLQRKLNPCHHAVIRSFQQVQRDNGLVRKGNAVHTFYKCDRLRVGRGAEVVLRDNLGDTESFPDLQAFHKDFAIRIRDIGAKPRPLLGVLNLNLEGDAGDLAVCGGFDDLQLGDRMIDEGQGIRTKLRRKLLYAIFGNVVLRHRFGDTVPVAVLQFQVDLAIRIGLVDTPRPPADAALRLIFLHGEGNVLNIAIIGGLNQLQPGSGMVHKGQRIGPFLDLDRLLPIVSHVVFGNGLNHGISRADGEAGNTDLAVFIGLAGKDDLGVAFIWPHSAS